MPSPDLYSDPKFNVPIELGMGRLTHSQAAGIVTCWRPFSKTKLNAVVVDVVVVGTGAGGFNIYKNGGSIGQVLTTNSAAGYRGTFVPATGTGTATSSIYDTTDTLELRNITSDTQHVTNVHINYQNQY